MGSSLLIDFNKRTEDLWFVCVKPGAMGDREKLWENVMPFATAMLCKPHQKIDGRARNQNKEARFIWHHGPHDEVPDTAMLSSA